MMRRRYCGKLQSAMMILACVKWRICALPRYTINQRQKHGSDGVVKRRQCPVMAECVFSIFGANWRCRFRRRRHRRSTIGIQSGIGRSPPRVPELSGNNANKNKRIVITKASRLIFRHSRRPPIVIPAPAYAGGRLRRESTLCKAQTTAAAKPPRIRRGFYIPVILATAGIHRRDSGDIIAQAIIAAFLLFARSANHLAKHRWENAAVCCAAKCGVN